MRGLKFNSNLIPKSHNVSTYSHRFAILVITRMKILLHLPSFNFSFNFPRWDNLPTALRDISLSLHLVFHLTLFHVFPYTLFPLSLSYSFSLSTSSPSLSHLYHCSPPLFLSLSTSLCLCLSHYFPTTLTTFLVILSTISISVAHIAFRYCLSFSFSYGHRFSKFLFVFFDMWCNI